MKILYVASEANPFIASGGLGDVMGALPKTIAKDNPDAEVSVILPLYATMKQTYKDMLTKYDDIPFKDITSVVTDFKNNMIETEVLLIDIREPNEIARAVEAFGAETILIRNPNVEKIGVDKIRHTCYNDLNDSSMNQRRR